MHFANNEKGCRLTLGLEDNDNSLVARNAIQMCMKRRGNTEYNMISACAKNLDLPVNNSTKREIKIGQRGVLHNAIRSCVERKKHQSYNPHTTGGARRTKRRAHKKRRTTRRR